MRISNTLCIIFGVIVVCLIGFIFVLYYYKDDVMNHCKDIQKIINNMQQFPQLKDFRTYQLEYPIIQCSLKPNIQHYQQLLQQAALINISNTGKLKDPLTHCLSGGKYSRPILVLEISRFYGSLTNPIPLALVSQGYHNASLLIDDLPSFDNDLERRGKQTTHVKYGVGVAQLCALMILSISTFNIATYIYNIAERCGVVQASLQQIQIQSKISDMMTIAIDGQYMDLIQSDTNYQEMSKEDIKKQLLELCYKKTASFFELSAFYGIISSTQYQNQELIKQISKLGKYIGIAYQNVDDIIDLESDQKKGKGSINMAVQIGIQETEQLINKYIMKSINILKTTGMWQHNQQFWESYLILNFGDYYNQIRNQCIN